MFFFLCCFARCCPQDLFTHVTFLYSSHLAFSIYGLFVSVWCIHRLISTQLQLGRNPTLFHQRSDVNMIDNQSIAVHVFVKRMLTSLSVDKMLPPRYVNLSIFLGLLLNMEMVPYLKDTNCFIYVHVEASLLSFVIPQNVRSVISNCGVCSHSPEKIGLSINLLSR